MSFYKNVRAEIKEHRRDTEEYIKIGEIRYIKQYGIYYACVDYGKFCNEESIYKNSHQCALCVFGDESRFPGTSNCKPCGYRERPDGIETIFRPVEL